jgi:hypothetical protein
MEIKILYNEDIDAAKRLLYQVYTETKQPSMKDIVNQRVEDEMLVDDGDEGAIWIGAYDNSILVGTCRLTLNKHDIEAMLKYIHSDLITKLPKKYIEASRIVVAASHRGKDVYYRLCLEAMDVCKLVGCPLLYKSKVPKMIEDGKLKADLVGSFDVLGTVMYIFVCDPIQTSRFYRDKISKL